MKKLLMLSVAVMVGALALAACNNDKGSAQKAGEQIDNTYENAKTKVKNTVTEGPAEQAGKKVDEATDSK